MSGNQIKLKSEDSRKCCVPNCTSKRKNPANFKLISFPRNQEISAIWAVNCKVEKPKGKLICLSHFEKQFFGLNKLKPYALPTIFDWEPQFKDLPREIKKKPHTIKRKCCIKNCFSSNQTHRLFEFPEYEIATKEWYENCGLDKACSVENKFICERHFHTFDLIEGKLKNGSVPVLNLNVQIDTNTNDVSCKNDCKSSEILDENSGDNALDPTLEKPKDEPPQPVSIVAATNSQENLCSAINLLREMTTLNTTIETASALLSDVKQNLIDIEPVDITDTSIYATENDDLFIEPVSNSNSRTLSDTENDDFIIENVPIVDEPNIISEIFHEEDLTAINLTDQESSSSDCAILSDPEQDNISTMPTSIVSSSQNVSENDQNSSANVNFSIQSAVPNFNVASFPNDCNNSFQDLSDPANWPELTDEVIKTLIRIGPTQIINFDFPITVNGKFDPFHYLRTLANGIQIPRPWLVYSISKDAVYCFCCLIFRNNKHIVQQAFCQTGFKNWQHISLCLQSHDSNKTHIENFKSWKVLENCMKINRNNDCVSENTSKNEILYWNKVLRRLLRLVKFLGMQSLSFQGTSDTLHKLDNGNFLKLVEATAKFDKVLEEHLKKIVNIEMQNEYIGKSIQYDLINLIADSVKIKIASMVKTAKYYAIIVDSIPDKNHIEQISLMIRFVHQERNTFRVKEHFLGFLGKKNQIGDKLWDAILQELDNLKLSINDCRGQSYDYNSNMLVKKFDIIQKSKLLEPRIFYVPSASHTLNLLVSDSIRSSLDAVEFFESVQSLYTFLSSSSMRWEIYIKKVPSSTLERISEIKWANQIDALKSLRYNLKDIYEALLEISVEESVETAVAAESLANKILNFKFICSLFIWYDILKKVDMASVYLQAKNISLSYAILLLETTTQFLTGLKFDQIFNAYVNDAENYAKSLSIPYAFPNQPFSIFRKRNMSIDDENPKRCFKINFYLKVLNEAIDCINERCKLLKSYTNLFSFLNEYNDYNKFPNGTMMKCCKDLEFALTHNNLKDFEGQELQIEMKVLSPLIKTNKPGIETLEYLIKSKLAHTFPNSVVAFTILNTLPINVASGESKANLIRTYLRSKTAEDLLVNLPILSIEKEVVEMLDYDYIAEEFSKSKAKTPVYIN